MVQLNDFKLFDSHFHIIEDRYPLVPNQGFLPETFNTKDYLHRMQGYDLSGGAIVSGSFQAFYQSYLVAALRQLGPGFVGVTQLLATTSDEQILSLSADGIRALRFNLKRGGSESVDQLESLALRVYELVGWHVELYIDSRDLADLSPLLSRLPRVSIDHLGLSRAGFPDLLQLVEKGVYVKATGFGRVDFDVATALREIVSVNPDAPMFGTDLPSTRAPRPYADDDFQLVIDTLGEDLARKVFYDNAVDFYRLDSSAPKI
ncbi:MAG: amidohydrolase family protein [Desulfuromonadales bacterium]|nr:amidohydrolase family protein [Desulfuromonadales bacterium]MBN2791389.1 amidohydrolase family protein [Desulfuromonadales bacterium]